MGIGLLFSFAAPEPGYGRDWPSWPTLQMTYDALKNGLYALSGGLMGSLVGMYFLARYFPKLPVAGSAIAPNPEHDELQIDDPYPGVALIGDSGTAESLLRPAGKARFGRTLVDVVSEGEYIESGSRVVVVERQGNRVVVRRMG
jgi:membrane-bound serine protease (ClpP class)